MKADLHLHSHYSDGTEPPVALLRRASEWALDMVALTDHDTVEGVPEAMEAGRALGIRVIPGIEITCQFRHQELHLLAYFPPDPDAASSWRHPDLIQQLSLDARRRFRRAEQMVSRLNDHGIALSMDDVLAQTDSGKSKSTRTCSIGRPHVAAALVAHRHVTSMDDAFRDYLVRGRPGWVDKERAEASTIIDLVHRCGGIISLAHPGLLRDQRIPSELGDAGLDAVEIYHSRHHSSQTDRFRSWARERQLLVTGGSDCHGMLKGEPMMGRAFLQGDDLWRFCDRLNTTLPIQAPHGAPR